MSAQRPADLPPLPEPTHSSQAPDFTAEQMQAYARAALAQAQPSLTDAQIEVIEKSIWRLDSLDATERESNREFVRAVVRAAIATQAAQPVIYSPIAVKPTCPGGSHPNDKEPQDPARREYLDERGDDAGQGLDAFWKWGHAADWNDHKRHAAKEQAAQPVQTQGVPIDLAEVDALLSEYRAASLEWHPAPFQADTRKRYTAAHDAIRARLLAAAPQADPPSATATAAMQVYRGDICHKSTADDQSYGMWCPVSHTFEHGFAEGTKFYAAPQHAEPLVDAQISGGEFEAARGTKGAK